MNTFTKSLLHWHKSIDRNMPWKETNDPYKIWVSEIILQQTRVSQGTAYYLRFIERFPNIKALANAPQSDVLKAWEGLGYYSRARNLQEAARDIMHRFDGCFPNNYRDIISLKGIGPYTAAAISSFAFGGAYAVVDGNVKRVLSRYFAINQAIDSSEGQKKIEKLATGLLDQKKPAAFNQAIMDFGALICKPKAPDCMFCPLIESCTGYAENMVNVLPFKSKRTRVKDRYLYYLVCQNNDEILIRKRADSGIWAGLYEFPGIESQTKLTQNDIRTKLKLPATQILKKSSYVEHKLTHLKLHITFYTSSVIPKRDKETNVRLEKVSELHTFAFPKPILGFVKSIE